jgi:hypothetical protein
MIISSWNIKGLNNPLKQHEVICLMKKNKVDVCGFPETKMLSSRVACMQQLRSSTRSFFSNADIISTTRIILFWNPVTVKVDLLDSSTQGLHLSVSSLISQYSFMVTFVYGFNTIIARRSL